MSMRTALARKSVKITVLVACLILGVWLTYIDFSEEFPLPISALLTIAYVGLVILLVNLEVIPLPAGVDLGLFAGRSRLSDFVKALACAGAMLAWVWVGVRIVNNTPLGAAVLATPIIILVAASGYFFFRFVSGR